MASLRVGGALSAVACCLLVASPAAAAVELTAENFKELVVAPQKNAFVLCVLAASTQQRASRVQSCLVLSG
jgi:hypothetical protein